MSLREDIERRLSSNQVFYAHFVTNQDMKKIRDDTTNDIIKIFEKRIDELDKAAENEYDVDYWAALQDMREMLK